MGRNWLFPDRSMNPMHKLELLEPQKPERTSLKIGMITGFFAGFDPISTQAYFIADILASISECTRFGTKKHRLFVKGKI